MNDNKHIVVGKNVLESLTVGMYSDERVIFREYIQNSTDAIDKAIRAGILAKDNSRIDIRIDKDKREIMVIDNGTGIPFDQVFNTLGDIGKSIKDYAEDRGFRGIGRLGGLGYCNKLRFITSSIGEEVRTITTWDCKELKRLLQPNIEPDLDLIGTVDRVTNHEMEDEEKSAHYFKVVLHGVYKDYEHLLDFYNIKSYLSQVSPVPYNLQQWTELKKINEKLLELGCEPEEYRIYLENEQIFKPYKRSIKAGKSKDYIRNIEFFHDYKEDGSLFFLGWYGVTDLSGAIKQEENIRGLRVRKRNILIGDEATLNSFFGDNPTYRGRNKWFLGEIFVFEDNLIPNARRDDFEKNSVYWLFKKAVQKTTRDILVRLPEKYSKQRSERKKISDSTVQLVEIKREIETGVTEAGKSELIGQLENIKVRVKKVTGKMAPKQFRKPVELEDKEKDDTLIRKKEKLLQEVDELTKVVEDTGNFLAKQIPSQYSRDVRKVIQMIFEVIDEILHRTEAKKLQEAILEKLIIPKKKR